jgi:hypothetical protein
MTAPTEPIPGNFYSFNFVIEVTIKGVVHTGYKVECFRNPTSGEVRWGTLTINDPGVVKVLWMDDQQNGLASRKLEKPEDALGAEGSVGNLRLQFERILQLSRNFVVYALYSRDRNIRLAYGFERRIFESRVPERLN